MSVTIPAFVTVDADGVSVQPGGFRGAHVYHLPCTVVSGVKGIVTLEELAAQIEADVAAGRYDKVGHD